VIEPDFVSLLVSLVQWIPEYPDFGRTDSGKTNLVEYIIKRILVEQDFGRKL
jgi:hypothetical protein